MRSAERGGHTYHTNVYDYERRRVIWSGAHRDNDPLRRLFDWWGKERTDASGHEKVIEYEDMYKPTPFRNNNAIQIRGIRCYS